MYLKKPVLRSRTHVPAARGRGQERDGVLIGRGRGMDVDSLPICNSRVQANRPGPSSRADAAWSAPWKNSSVKGLPRWFRSPTRDQDCPVERLRHNWRRPASNLMSIKQKRREKRFSAAVPWATGSGELIFRRGVQRSPWQSQAQGLHRVRICAAPDQPGKTARTRATCFARECPAPHRRW